ncbi:MAG: hypothetical protein K2Y01_11290 [Rhabdochlamydiaceae bacterium]|nr:hypothetical protein [Rhabdochlamydiaceae bacterium]
MESVNFRTNSTSPASDPSKDNAPNIAEAKKAQLYGKEKIALAASASKTKTENPPKDPYKKYRVALSHLDEPSKKLVEKEIDKQVIVKEEARRRRIQSKPGYKKTKKSTIVPTVSNHGASVKVVKRDLELSKEEIKRSETPPTIAMSDSEKSNSTLGEAVSHSAPQKSMVERVNEIKIRPLSAIKDVFARLTEPFRNKAKQIHP